jgi:hypothetical protein
MSGDASLIPAREDFIVVYRRLKSALFQWNGTENWRATNDEDENYVYAIALPYR